MSNFLFLKKNNENLFSIISEAENLFRDEYFEQSVVQVRRFAENLCKDLLAEKVLADDTFDTMICKIKDNSFNNIRMRELADDLYFLKKHGNNSAHSSSASKREQAGKLAIECLERAYEIAIFYSNVKFGNNKKLDKTVFSEELLMTGKKTGNKMGNGADYKAGKKSSPKILKERYSDELKKTRAKAPTAKIIKFKKPQKTGKRGKRGKSKKKTKLKTKILLAIIAIIILALVYLVLNFV